MQVNKFYQQTSVLSLQSLDTIGKVKRKEQYEAQLAQVRGAANPCHLRRACSSRACPVEPLTLLSRALADREGHREALEKDHLRRGVESAGSYARGSYASDGRNHGDGDAGRAATGAVACKKPTPESSAVAEVGAHTHG